MIGICSIQNTLTTSCEKNLSQEGWLTLRGEKMKEKNKSVKDFMNRWEHTLAEQELQEVML